MNRKERRKKKGIEYARKQNKEVELLEKCRELNDLVDYFNSIGAIGFMHYSEKNIEIQFAEDKLPVDNEGWKKEIFRGVFYPYRYSKVYEGIKCFYLSKK